MFRDDSNETLETSKDSTVDDDWAGHDRFIGGAVSQVEALWQLEIKLDGSALEGATQSIPNRDINLGAVECAVSWIELPFSGIVFVERLRELLKAVAGRMSQRGCIYAI